MQTVGIRVNSLALSRDLQGLMHGSSPPVAKLAHHAFDSLN
jgi:hypothetical protein